MNHSENPDAQLPFDKESIKRQNNEDYMRLYVDVQEMKEELRSGKLSPLAKADLEEKILETQKALDILRESIKALSQEALRITTDEIPLLEVEVTDKETFYHNQHLEKLRELEALEKERELLFDLLPSEKISPALEKIEDRIKEAKKEAEASYEQYLLFSKQ